MHAASRRAFSALASKIHPQLPLSPRESQQLLNLLTTSFRAHLDREHPVPLSENSVSKDAQKPAVNKAQPNASLLSAESSYGSATQHIESILTNPLFAVKPRQRGSEPAAIDALADPISWFIDQIATGAADIPKASMCLEMLQRTTAGKYPGTFKGLNHKRKPGALIAEWLQTSGRDTTKEFLSFSHSQDVASQGRPKSLLGQLAPLLIAEGEEAYLWRWFARSPELRMEETGLDASRVLAFRTQVLLSMIHESAAYDLDKALTIFLRAQRMVKLGEHGLTYKVLQPAGASLVRRIVANPQSPRTPELHESLLLPCRQWLGHWAQAVQAMLWVHHPIAPTATPGLEFIKNPKGAITFVHQKNKRPFLVQLCLSVARQLLAEQEYNDAQVAMDFTKDHFADLVLSKHPNQNQQAANRRKEQREKQNLEMLDRLLPT